MTSSCNFILVSNGYQTQQVSCRSCCAHLQCCGCIGRQEFGRLCKPMFECQGQIQLPPYGSALPQQISWQCIWKPNCVAAALEVMPMRGRHINCRQQGCCW